MPAAGILEEFSVYCVKFSITALPPPEKQAIRSSAGDGQGSPIWQTAVHLPPLRLDSVHGKRKVQQRWYCAVHSPVCHSDSNCYLLLSQAILDVVVNLQFSLIEKLWQTFWRYSPPDSVEGATVTENRWIQVDHSLCLFTRDKIKPPSWFENFKCV